MKTSARRRKFITSAVTLLAVFVPLCGFVVATGSAQSQREQKVLEDKIPAHVPVKVKVKNLDHEHWARDLEVEVRNTGSKPIYSLSFFIVMPEVLGPDGNPLGFGFDYGRAALGDISERPTAEDIPLKPGETHTFRIEERFVKGWEKHQANSVTEPTKFQLKLSGITFGDGTGFLGTHGAPLPSRSAGNAPCEPKRPVGASGPHASNSPRSYFKDGADYLPVSFLPASFFLPAKAEGGNLNPAAPQSCCADYTCDYLKRVRDGYNCQCGPADWVVSVSCRETGGSCGKVGSWDRVCLDEYGYEYYCPVFYIDPCAGWDSI